jgi:hypothetical protein
LKAQINYYKSDCGIKIPDACEATKQSSVSFTLVISNLATPSANAARLCNAINTEVSGWFQITPDQISCLYVSNTASKFEVNFLSSSLYVQVCGYSAWKNPRPDKS